MNSQMQQNVFNYRPLVKLGAIATILKFILIVLGIVLMGIYGVRPISAPEAFEMMHQSRIIGLMRDEILVLVMISLYLFSFSALFVIVAKYDFTKAFIATLLTFVSVIVAIASHSGFSLMHLSELYYSTADEVIRSQLIGAGEAVLATNMWNGTAGYFTGIFMQGSGILMSLAMIKTNKFSRLTIYSGLLCNGLDLLQHMIHHTFEGPAEIMLLIAGPFYFVWFIMLAKDLFKIAKEMKTQH